MTLAVLLFVVMTCGCGTSSTASGSGKTVDSQLAAIRAAGLDAAKVRPMAEDSPAAPHAADGKHFAIASVAKATSDPTAGGGVFVLRDQAAFGEVAAYYAAFSGGGLLKTYSCIDPKSRTVLYVNGAAKESLAEKYCQAIGTTMFGD